MSGAKKLTRAQRDTIDTAWHEAGHAVAMLALGVRVSSVWLTGERAAVGRLVGRAQADVLSIMDTDERVHHLHNLAGDAVDKRRSGLFGGSHVLDVSREVGPDAFPALWDEARALVEDHWQAIERLALALLEAPDYGLYGDDVAHAAGMPVVPLPPEVVAMIEARPREG